ncbi:membrane-bound lytic murein transglycosylase MltF [Henriciella aquimarina]|uniref:membrane-bound lytic murein transglycosylase MltF n=1 Tax=Henriciella aquimarina TaxID=545261 RepID=UPI000A067E6A|nr:membrane-bound lytic murein transglycosylase MltF [Henriciella aquimarina]
MDKKFRIGLAAGAALLAGLGITQCRPAQDAALVTDSTTIETVKEGGNLVVLTLKGPTTYREADDGPMGYEVDMIKAFAKDLGVTPRFVAMEDIGALIAAIENGEGHVAAAGLTITDLRAARVSYGPAYKNVEESLVCHQDGPAPVDLDELTGVNLTVMKDSAYVETLKRLKTDHPQLKWKARAAGSAMPMLVSVAKGRIDCTVADSHIAEYARRLYPDLVIPMSLSTDKPLGWIYNSKLGGMDETLDSWFSQAHASGLLETLDERWFGHLDEFDYVEVLRFVERVEDRLPEYRTYFETAAADTAFDWHLLAAQAYQESHWDPQAVSPTGVRGIMMLTLPTARELGVEDRNDPAQSVDGGARYLQRLYDRLPDGVEGEDRTWFALAAYNIGMGHIYDARRLAERRGLDKNSWTDLETILPLLSKKQYYSTLRHGYARGYEPVRYVRKVRDYYNMLRANVPV